MSSDSEEDFLSADEGSDYDIPKEKFVVADEVKVYLSHSTINELKTTDQRTLEKTEELHISAEYVHVKVSLLDEDIVEPSSSNVVIPHSTQMKDLQKDVITPTSSDKCLLNEQHDQFPSGNCVEREFSCHEGEDIVNTQLQLEDSSKPAVSTIHCSSGKSSFKIPETYNSHPDSKLMSDKPETRPFLQETQGDASCTAQNVCKDTKLSGVSDLAINCEISKSSSSSNVTGEPGFEAPALHMDQIDAGDSVDKLFNTSIRDLQSTENRSYLDSTENIPNLDCIENIPDQHSTDSISDVHHTGKIPDTQSGENLSTLHSIDSKPDQFLTKPRKTSKIGLKKPREKLGERMGVKKLGSKINKPLESISCDTLKSQSTTQDNDNQSIHHFTSKTDNGKKDVSDGTSDKDNKVEVDSSWGSSWGGWGTSLLSAASTLKQEVGRGVGSVVELVEDSIGVPSPEELAKEQRERERILELEVPDAWQENWSQSDGESTSIKKPYATATLVTDEALATDTNSAASSNNSSTPDSGLSTSRTASAGGGFTGLSLGGLSSLVSGVSGALETAGSKVVFGGLDTLELIGRRTMDVLQESDPNLRSRKDRLLQRVNKPNLAAVLREAREKAVANPTPDNDGDSLISLTTAFSSRITFANLWDNSTGAAHLEALALIARQCSTNIRTLQASLTPALRREADIALKEIMALSEIDEENLGEGNIFSERVTATIRALGLRLNADNIAQCWSDLSIISEQYSEGSSSLSEASLDGPTVLSNVVGSCVSLVERLVEVAHKAAEVSLVTSPDELDSIHLATQYRELVVLGGSQLESCADAVCTGLSSTPQQEKLTPTITNIYMQVCEGSSCLQQSLVHLCTTLQLVELQRITDSLT